MSSKLFTLSFNSSKENLFVFVFNSSYIFFSFSFNSSIDSKSDFVVISFLKSDTFFDKSFNNFKFSSEIVGLLFCNEFDFISPNNLFIFCIILSSKSFIDLFIKEFIFSSSKSIFELLLLISFPKLFNLVLILLISFKVSFL